MPQTRREFIKQVGIGTAALTIPALYTSCGKPRRPNILFIMSDDHAEQAISCYGSKLIDTPNIDRIAQMGIRFNNSFVTNSICGPSRATMLTGKYSHKNGLRDNRDEFDGSQMTFPKLLRGAGYQTGIIGKWHLKTDPTGFDVYKILKGQGVYYNPSFNVNGEWTDFTGYTTDVITDLALDVLDNRDTEKPFCLLVHHKAPHRNWMPDTKHLNEFQDDLPLPTTFYDDYKTREQTAGAADMRINDMYLSFDMKLNPGYYDHETGTGGKISWAKTVEESWSNTLNHLTPEQRAAWDAHYDKINADFKAAQRQGRDLLEWKYQQYIKDYLRCILSVDENIGRVLDYFDQHDLTRDTIVIYTSDQGFYLGEHGWYDKRFMYEESLGMPLVMAYPREIPAGQILDQLVMNLDFAPTFLDYANVPIPPEIQGVSFRSIVGKRKSNDWRSAVYYHYYEYPHGWHNVKRHYGIRTDRYKLIHFYNNLDIWELYDLQADPAELNNVYGQETYRKIQADLHRQLEQLREEYEDTVLETT